MNIRSERVIQEIYNKVKAELGIHNYFIEAKSKRKKCIDCKKRALTFNQPNDHVRNSRGADYRIICLNCQTTQLIKSNDYSDKQGLKEFLSELIKHFNLKF